MVKVILSKDVINKIPIKNIKEGELCEIEPENLKGIYIKITVFCQECGKELYQGADSVYRNYLRNGLFSCKECSVMRKYGCKCALLNPEVREKRRKTCLERYGVEEPLGSKEIQKKTEQTCLKRYGYKRAMMNSEVQKHNRQAFMEKYGVEFVGEVPEVREKIKNTIKERYGVDNPIYVPEFKEKAIRKRLENINDIFHDGIPTSSQQRYFNKIYGGEMNQLVRGYFVDILLTDSVYFEYNGSGHNLNFQLGRTSQEEFDKKEQMRESILEKYGYKEFKIVSSTDKLPDEQFLLELKDKAIEKLNSGYNFFIYNIETKETIVK